MLGTRVGGLALCLAGWVCLPGCALAYRECHESPLLTVYAKMDVPGAGEARNRAASFEDSIIAMTEEFGVPLQDVIPVRVYVDGGSSSGRSYFNRITRSIVLGGSPDPVIFSHELSHLLTHHILRSPPYWADQALAEYMETRVRGESRKASAERRRTSSRPSKSSPDRSEEKSHYLIRRMAEARSPAEVLDHLTPQAVDEDRSWGMIVVRYLFESRWAGLSAPEKIRALLSLEQEDVEAYAPDLLDYCRGADLLAGEDRRFRRWPR
jgi:hypothetical protein